MMPHPSKSELLHNTPSLKKRILINHANHTPRTDGKIFTGDDQTFRRFVV